MSLEAARRWLETHHRPLPSPACLLEPLREALVRGASSDRLLAVIRLNPLLAGELLSAVNSRSTREPVESLEAAASLLGDSALKRLLQQHLEHQGPPAEPQPSFLYQQLLARSLHNAEQVTAAAHELGFSDIESLHTAASLMYLGELSCCLQAPEDYLDVCRQGGEPQAAESVFGFDFSELGQLIAEQMKLPERVILAQPHRQSADAKTRLLRLTTRLCRHCEQGWRDDRVTADLQQLAELMHKPIERIATAVHRTAVDAARICPLKEAWQPASRLPLIEDGFWQPPQVAVSSPQSPPPATPAPPRPKTAVRGSRTRDRLQQLLHEPGSTQSQLLQACLLGLQQELGFTRVSLFLLSKDRRMLHNRLALGLDEQAPLRRYAVDTARAGLLARLLEKPLALHVSPAHWSKYEALIPPSLLARLDTRDFVLMSVFIADKPIGVVLADRKGSGPIDAGDFRVFKQIVGLCAKALTLAARRR